jgi:preprotein translocase subunit SecA
MTVLAKTLTTIFGSRNERLLKRYHRIVDQINAKEAEVTAKSDGQLRTRTEELRASIKAGAIRPADAMPEAFAIIREAMDRFIGIRQIFNPEVDENTQRFDPDQLDDAMLQEYDKVQQRMIATGQNHLQVEVPTELYAAIRKLYPDSRPPFRARCFDVQLIGGVVLYEGRIAEMATGEGKTFVAPLACYMRALEGLHCQVVTVNDYLVRRDAMWVRPPFEALGLSVGFIQSDMEPGGAGRKREYQCDVTYGTNSEFGFDYLRDNMKERRDLQVQGPLDFAIVDEVDSILIDEARTPLIISGLAHDDAPKYRQADEVARKVIELNKPWDAAEKLVDSAKRAIKAAQGDEDKAKNKAEKEGARKRQAEGERQLAEAEKKKEGLVQYYEVEMDRKSAHLTHEGIAAAQEAANVGSFYVGANMDWPHLMEQSMRAHVVYERDKDYVVERGQRGELEVVIVDEYTGRKMVGRQWSDGLHQAVEAKERVPIKQETQTLATITLQNFFKLYKSLAGMTGTAQTEAEEFAKIYKLEVVTIPTNRPVVRQDNEDKVYRKEGEKWDAIIDEIHEIAYQGRPVLVGTTSVEKSERISNMLKRKFGIEHEVLNAKQHEREAHIVAKAGQQHKDAHGETVGNVTIATNMAGRGTDIKLAPSAQKAGGLHVIGTERHTARRIDNQLRGRGGRQGDPGSSRFYVSLEDELMKMFAGEWTIKVLGWLGMEEGMAIEDKRITKGIIRAQKKVEERNFLGRKNLLEYDEVMDHQRTTFYGMRQRVLEGQGIDDIIWGMIGDAIRDAVEKFITRDYAAANIAEWARINLEVVLDPEDLIGRHEIHALETYLKDHARAEAEANLTATLGEYVDENVAEGFAWDVKGLSAWAMSRFHVALPQSQIRKMGQQEVEMLLRDAAVAQIDATDTSPLLKYLEPMVAEKGLAQWAKDKFVIEVAPEEFLVEGTKDRDRKTSAEIADLIEKRAREAYARREIEYPVDHVLAFAFGAFTPEGDNPYSADFLRAWALQRYGIDLSIDHIRQTPPRGLRDELIGYQEQFLADGKLREEVDKLLKVDGSAADVNRAFAARFGGPLPEAEVESAIAADPSRGALRELLIFQARRRLRQELTDLEQYVLIQIFDTSWKDHLYAMDILKGSVGLKGFAEQDPRIVYKKEGFEYFQQMMQGVRDKVTELIFRARVAGRAPVRSAYRETAAVHQDAGGYGVAENLAAAANVDTPPAAAEEQPNEAVAVKTIVRDQPKVGRNDLCPCGSGKKYKKCCGVNAA